MDWESVPGSAAAPSAEYVRGHGHCDVEAGEAQDAEDPFGCPGEHEMKTVRLGAPVLGEREPQAGRVDEGEPGKIQDDTVAGLLDVSQHPARVPALAMSSSPATWTTAVPDRRCTVTSKSRSGVSVTDAPR